MPLYEFECADGSRIEAHYPVSEMPRIGDAVYIDGQRVVRVMSLPRMNVVNVGHEAVGMHSIRHGRDPDVPRYSPENTPGLLGGFPLFKDKAEIREYEAKKRARGVPIKYDP